MCGIVGVLSRDSFSDESLAAELRVVERQLNSIAHRGPDGLSTFSWKNGIFGHVRLSIIDLTTGDQPMSSEDGRFTIIFNGEIYNYLELRSELEKTGARFRTNSDTEVLLYCYRQWGVEALSKLNGMFAFVIFDSQQGEAICARDPYGQKPFYYWQNGDRFYFASEVRAFKEIPTFRAVVSASSVAHFLAFDGFYFDQTVYEGVRKLPPGHFLRWKNGATELKKYYHSVPENRGGELTYRSAIEQADQLAIDSVRLASRADVPVAVLLSGGLDSALVLAYHRKNHPHLPISAFHLRVNDPTYDEYPYAKGVADNFGVQLNVIDLDYDRLGTLARTVPSLLDEPQADPGILAKFMICEEISKNFKVALTGDGSDELFYGYVIMKAQQMARAYRFVPSILHNSIIAPIIHSLPARSGYMSSDFLAKRFIRGFPGSESLRSFRWMGAFTETELAELLRGNLWKQGIENGKSYLGELTSHAEASGPLGRFAYQLQNTFLPDFVLCNSDRASMLNSLELRSPLLDVRLAHFANSLPDRWKMPQFKTKHFLKDVALRHLPSSLVFRKKQGFTVPVATLMKTVLREEIEELFSEKTLNEQGLFSHKTIRHMLDRHFSGKENLYKPLWSLYVLQKWLHKNRPQFIRE